MVIKKPTVDFARNALHDATMVSVRQPYDRCIYRCIYCLDLCGKKIHIFGFDTAVARSDDIFSSHAITLEGVQKRIDRIQHFLASELDTGNVPKNAHIHIRAWLLERKDTMEASRRQLHTATVVTGMILKYDSALMSHYVSISGTCSWLQLENLHYTELLSSSSDKYILDHDAPSFTSVSAIATSHQRSSSDASSSLWMCGWIQADARLCHETHDCPLRRIPCPLACGMLFEQHQMAHHVAHGCLKRIVQCRLGCHMTLTMEERLVHEQRDCEWR
jgi:hypothetical protein